MSDRDRGDFHERLIFALSLIAVAFIVYRWVVRA